ncbi:hypothetical protein [Solidesulfovibrio sp.]|uniref:hypothetical protein n=1 Tax=Solidesulfovibrio sp. TaxID=2910990 RepID=UPI00261742B8|nr:hypothetical protein [Solidesulfovibrio sp.]
MGLDQVRCFFLAKSAFSPRNYRILLICLVALGLALQVRHLLSNRSLWLDEAFLSLAVLQRSLSNILSLPLPYEQTPPPLFLVLVKILTNFLGTSEIVLRSIPFMSSALTLCLFPMLSRKHSQSSLLVGTFLLAFSYGSIYYAAEFKPYSTEALLSVLFILAGISFSQGGPIKHPFGWGLVFVIAPWLGLTTVFMLAGVGGGLLFAQMTSGAKQPRKGWALLTVGFVSLLAMFVCYALPASQTQLRMDYWKTFEAPLPNSLQAVVWYGERAALILCHFFGLHSPWQGAALFGLAAIGGFALLKRDPAYGLVLVLPIAAAVLLSLAGKFPLHERLLVFTLPICCLLLAEGSTVLGTRLALRWPVAYWLPVAALLGVLARPVAAMVLDPGILEHQEFKKISEEILQRSLPGDAVFVFQAAVPIWQYYSQRDPRIAKFHPLTVIRGNQASLQEAERTVQAAGHGWVIFVHLQRPEERQLEKDFEDSGALRMRMAVKGAWAFAFDVKSE